MAESGGAYGGDDFDFHNPDVDIDDHIDISPIPMSTHPVGVDVDLPTGEGLIGRNLQLELIQNEVDAFYKRLQERDGVSQVMKDYSRFDVKSDGLYLKTDSGDIRITVKNQLAEPLALTTLSKKIPAAIMRRDLGLEPTQSSKVWLAPDARRALQEARTDLPFMPENVPMQEMSGLVDRTEAVVNTLESSLTDDGLSGILETMNDTPLGRFADLRELHGLNRAMQTIRGELTNNLAKLSQLDTHISQEQTKLDEAQNNPDISQESVDEVAARLKELRDERDARLEAASTNRDDLRSQVSRIRETINHVLNSDTSLAERLHTLFREQGVTITSIITAVGFIISTLVLALLPAGGATPPPPPPKPSQGGLKEWVKKHLQALGSVLAKLAGRAAAALPGIIGSIISWLLNFISKSVGWLAQNLWALVVGLGGLLYVTARDKLLEPKQS